MDTEHHLGAYIRPRGRGLKRIKVGVGAQERERQMKHAGFAALLLFVGALGGLSAFGQVSTDNSNLWPVYRDTQAMFRISYPAVPSRQKIRLSPFSSHILHPRNPIYTP